MYFLKKQIKLLLPSIIIANARLVPTISTCQALRLSVPPSDGFKDIAVQGGQHIDSNSDLVYNYIQLINQYLWFSITVICFIAIVRLGFQLITNPVGSEDGKTALKNTILGAGAGLLVAMMSYVVVRLVLNLL